MSVPAPRRSPPPRGRTAGLLAIGALLGATYALAPAHLHAPDPVEPERAAGQSGRLVVDLVDGATVRDLEDIEALVGSDLDWVSPLSEDEALAVGVVGDMAGAIARLQADPRVEAVEPEIELQALAFPDDPLFDKQWNLRKIGAPVAWELTPRGKGIVVAVVDTGVARVEDLAQTHVLPGASFVPGAATADDDQGHGTHVAGTIAQSTNNGIGVAGVAPAATILPVKVLSASGAGSSAWIAAGIDYAVDEGADVINLSLGGGYSDVIHEAVKKARASGVIVIAAAGNNGREGVSWPGALPEAIGVSAFGPSGDLAPYSSWGEGVDISAPGGDKRQPNGGILQDSIDGRGGHAYQEFQGTSMAAPHVAGAAAILLSTGLPVDAVEQALLGSAQGTGGTWDSKVGYGHLDIGKALGNQRDRGGAARFALAAGLALAIGAVGRTSRGYRAVTALLAGWAAAGLFFLPHLPLPRGTWMDLASHGPLAWPSIVGGPGWMHFPLWLSAALPVFAAILIGAVRPLRPIAAGLAIGVGAHLLQGAATGGLDPWWFGDTAAALWLGANAAIALGLGLALAGMQHLEEKSA